MPTAEPDLSTGREDRRLPHLQVGVLRDDSWTINAVPCESELRVLTSGLGHAELSDRSMTVAVLIIADSPPVIGRSPTHASFAWINGPSASGGDGKPKLAQNARRRGPSPLPGLCCGEAVYPGLRRLGRRAPWATCLHPCGVDEYGRSTFRRHGTTTCASVHRSMKAQTHRRCRAEPDLPAGPHSGPYWCIERTVQGLNRWARRAARLRRDQPVGTAHRTLTTSG